MSEFMTTPSEQKPSSNKGFSAHLTRFLGSMNLAITLLVALGIASVIGTVLKQNENYSNYIIKFGPFWHEIFKTLGLYDVYIAGWFLFILVFLMVSTSVCVLRNTPLMLRDMRHFRLNVQEKSLRAFHHVREEEVDASPEMVLSQAQKLFAGQGFRVREKDAGDHSLVVGMRGGWSRLGYVFAHLGIIVILVGGTLDSKIPLHVGQLMGRVVVEHQDIPASEVPEKSRLAADNPSFRGNVNIPEGKSANVVFLGMDDGYLVQSLPFQITVKDFRVEHYATGQPKSFESDVVLHDPKQGKTIEQTISVNHPLIYENFAIYQASFGDGGTNLDLKLWSLNPEYDEPFSFTGNVFKTYPLPSRVYGPMKLEITDFRLFNIEPVLNKEGKTEQRNMGPSFNFKVRNEEGVAKEYRNYMNPLEQGGRYFYISGMRDTPTDQFRYLNIPQDREGGVKRFMTFLAYLHDEARITKVAQEATQKAVEGAGMDKKLQGQLSQTMQRLLMLFARGGYDAILEDINQNMPEDKRQAAAEAFIKVLHSGTQAVYLSMLKDLGVEDPDDRDWQFYEDAVSAISVLPYYGSPYYLKLDSFKHIQASGLQITRSPGKAVVYLGSFMLIVGVFMMFYIAHQRFWVRVTSTESGSRVLIAGTSNRNPLEFDGLFTRLSKALFGSLNKST
jgi:cytochrome c biogenesis protein